MRIVVVGAGKVGYYLIRTLLDRGHKVSLVERDARRCRIIAEELGILAVNGDGVDLAVLVDAGCDDADVVASVTGMDEVNLIVCQVAKQKLGAPKVVARISNPKNRDVLRKLGVDVAISGTSLIADAIEEEILHKDMRTLFKLHHNLFSIVEMVVPDRSPAAERAIRDLAAVIPRSCVFVSVIRGDEGHLVRGGTVIHAGDTVIALVHRSDEDGLRKLVQG